MYAGMQTLTELKTKQEAEDEKACELRRSRVSACDVDWVERPG